MASFKGKSCFVIGGWGVDDKILSIVSRYSIVKDQWESDTPAL